MKPIRKLVYRANSIQHLYELSVYKVPGCTCIFDIEQQIAGEQNKDVVTLHINDLRLLLERCEEEIGCVQP